MEPSRLRNLWLRLAGRRRIEARSATESCGHFGGAALQQHYASVEFERPQASL
jgi:hypothetical protein